MDLRSHGHLYNQNHTQTDESYRNSHRVYFFTFGNNQPENWALEFIDLGSSSSDWLAIEKVIAASFQVHLP